MLSDLDAKVNASASIPNEKKELTAELAQQLFEQYKSQQQAAGKAVIYAQFSLMLVEVLPPDEVQIISPSELTDTYAREQRTQLIDFFREQTGIMVRVTTGIREDEAAKEAAKKNAVLSKSEVYDAMAQKNPDLSRLRDGLGLTLEY
jgi:hypothetical protein